MRPKRLADELPEGHWYRVHHEACDRLVAETAWSREQADDFLHAAGPLSTKLGIARSECTDLLVEAVLAARDGNTKAADMVHRGWSIMKGVIAPPPSITLRPAR